PVLLLILSELPKIVAPFPANTISPVAPVPPGMRNAGTPNPREDVAVPVAVKTETSEVPGIVGFVFTFVLLDVFVLVFSVVPHVPRSWPRVSQPPAPGSGLSGVEGATYCAHGFESWVMSDVWK